MYDYIFFIVIRSSMFLIKYIYCVGDTSVILFNQRVLDYRSSKFDIPTILVIAIT